MSSSCDLKLKMTSNNRNIMLIEIQIKSTNENFVAMEIHAEI